jgi:hypothetical protein
MANPTTTGLVQAIDSFAGSFGVIREDDLLAADHPIVKKFPSMFVPAGKTTEEIHAVKMQYHVAALKKAGRIDQ